MASKVLSLFTSLLTLANSFWRHSLFAPFAKATERARMMIHSRSVTNPLSLVKRRLAVCACNSVCGVSWYETVKQDHEAVRTLAIQIGVRPAARKLNLNENTVRAWSKREGWFELPTLPPTHNDSKAATSATKPGDVALQTLHSDISKSRSKLARLAHDSINEAQPVKLKNAKDLRDVGGLIQQLGPGWDAKSEGLIDGALLIGLAHRKPIEKRVEGRDVTE